MNQGRAGPTKAPPRPTPPELRRGPGRHGELPLLRLIQSHAVLHQAEREQRMENGQPVVLARYEDLEAVWELVQPILGSGPAPQDPAKKDILEVVRELQEHGKVFRRDIEARLGCSTSALNKWLKELVHDDQLKVDTPGAGKTPSYACEEPDEAGWTPPSREAVEAFLSEAGGAGGAGEVGGAGEAGIPVLASPEPTTGI